MPASPPSTSPPDASQSDASSKGDAQPSFANVLRRVGRDLDRSESVLRTAAATWTGGEEWNAGQLLSLQAGAYRTSEIIDVASRLVDRAASSVKTVLQGSGQ
jgi:hypothetical protein